jgi:hypothetical protein
MIGLYLVILVFSFLGFLISYSLGSDSLFFSTIFGSFLGAAIGYWIAITITSRPFNVTDMFALAIGISIGNLIWNFFSNLNKNKR